MRPSHHKEARIVRRARGRVIGRQAVQATLVAAFVLTAAACSSEADEAGAAVAAQAAGGGTQNRLCSLFTREEIGRLLGSPVAEGQVAGPLDTACQWDGTQSDDVYAQIQVLDAEYWSKPHGARGYEAVSGIGREAYVVPELGGWAAGSLQDRILVAVSVSGGTSNRDTALRLLRDAIARM